MAKKKVGWRTLVKEAKEAKMAKKKVGKKRKVAKVKLGVGAIAKACIMKAYDFQKTYAAVKKVHKDTGFSKRCYYWYRTHLKTDDKKAVPAIQHSK